MALMELKVGVFFLTCVEVKGPGWDGVCGPEAQAWPERQADVNGSLDLQLLIATEQGDANGG